MEITAQLSDADWEALQEVNRLLTQLTDKHHHCCECEMCKARWLTDVQEPEARMIRFMPFVSGVQE